MSKEFSTKVDRVLFNRHSNRDNLHFDNFYYPCINHGHNTATTENQSAITLSKKRKKINKYMIIYFHSHRIMG